MLDSELAKVGALVVALFVGGTPALAGGTYLAAAGSFSPYVVFVASLTTTLLWDTIWYLIGRTMTLERIRAHRLFRKNGRFWDTALRMYGARQYELLFASRFAYGTNSITSIVSGLHRMPYAAFLLISGASIALWFFALQYLSRILYGFFGNSNISFALSIALIAVVSSVIVVRFGVRYLFLRYVE